jgi:RNA polymerase sigma-70 factor (ECF subfamily)
MDDDARLVERTLEGDNAAFGLLYDRYARVIRAVCFDATGDVGAARELTQDVFVRAFAKLSKLRSGARFGPWLVSMARHVCREWLRFRRRDRHRYMDVLPETHDRPPDETDDRAARLRQAISRLPERERLALHLFYLKGELSEVARAMLGLSHAGFYKLVARARERVAGMMLHEQETLR